MAEIDNLAMQQQLQKLFADRIPLLQGATKEMQEQLRIAVQLKAAFDSVSIKDFSEKLGEAQEALDKMADKATGSSDIAAKAMKKMSDSIDGASDGVSDLSKLTAMYGTKSQKSFGMVQKAMMGTVATAKSLLTLGGGIVSSFFNIGKAVAAIPFRIFSNLLSDAASFTGDSGLMQAIEDLRKEFGDLSKGTSKDVLDATKTLSSGLQATGLSVYQVFESPAEQVKYMTELFKGAGAQALQFGSEIGKAGGAIAAFDKGLGLGAENMKGMMNRATAMGTSLQEQLRVTANYSLQMGESFGISQKILSKDIGMMTKDVANFGSMTQKQMVISAIYTKKLGLETKDLLKLIDKFDNFEDAANSAAMLSQAFGANIDAFKMMNEQDPAKRLDELRKSMNAAGKSSDNMSRQELKLLASTSGLSEEAAKLAFSTKNQGLSYDEIQKKANKAENSQMRQTQALEKLAASIERVVRTGGQMQGSFLGQFTAGMERGIKMSGPYLGLMKNLRSGLMQTFWAGNQVGKMFAEDSSLGVGPFLKSAAKVFDPAKVKNFLSGVTTSFQGLFKGDLTVEGFLKNIREKFMNVFGGQDFSEMRNSLKTFAMRVSKGLGEASVFILHTITNSFKKITEFIKDPSAFLAKLKSGGAEGKSFAGKLISQFSEAFKDPNIIKNLLDALKDLISTVSKKLISAISGNAMIKKIAFAYGAAAFGKAAGGAILQNAGSIIKLAGPMMKSLGPVVSGIAKSMGPMISQAASTLAPIAGPVAAVAAIAAIGLAATGISKGIKKYQDKLIKSGLEPTKAKVTAASAGIIDALTFGLLPDGASLEIGKAVGEVSDMVLKSVESVFGKNFAKSLKEFFSTSVDLGAAFGDTITALFSGDVDKFLDASVDLADKWFKFVSKEIVLFIDMIPKMALKIEAFANKLAGTFAQKMSEAFDKIGDKLGPFGAFFKGMAAVMDVMSTFYKLSSIMFKQLGFYWDSINISGKFDSFSKSITGTGDTIKNFFTNDIPNAIKGFLSDVFGVSGKQFDDFIKTITDAIDKVKGIVGDSAIGQAFKSAGNALDSIKGSYKNFKNDVDAASKMIDTQDKMKSAAQAAAEKQVPSAIGGGAVVPGDIEALVAKKRSLEENIKSLNDIAKSDTIAKAGDMLIGLGGAMDKFNEKFATSTFQNTLQATKQIAESVNQLNEAFSDTSANATSMTVKLQKFANNSGLGKSGTYEIKNRAINLKLDLKVVMDAGEVEKAIVLRKESIIFDALEDIPSLNLDNPEYKSGFDRLRTQKGGG